MEGNYSIYQLMSAVSRLEILKESYIKEIKMIDEVLDECRKILIENENNLDAEIKAEANNLIAKSMQY